MPSFNANTALDPLEYDLRPYAPDAVGTVPEPSDTQVAKFYADTANQLRLALPPERLEGVDLEDPNDLLRLSQSLSADENALVYESMLDTYAAVCSEHPSREELAALPFRLRRAFYGAVSGWLRPES